MRTLTNSHDSEQPGRQTATISRELKRLQIDLAALSEASLADEGQLNEEKGDILSSEKESLSTSYECTV